SKPLSVYRPHDASIPENQSEGIEVVYGNSLRRTPTQIRRQFVFSGKNDEPTLDFRMMNRHQISLGSSACSGSPGRESHRDPSHGRRPSEKSWPDTNHRPSFGSVGGSTHFSLAPRS